ncbi:MAG TPA: hypothetical protein VF614_10570 [Chthoniobacteraceae bacterium]|jgi:hypothetical protein
MKQEDERDDLWELLGHARKPEISPFFSRDILREIRQQEQERTGIFSRFRFAWGLGAATACAVAVLLFTQTSSRQPVAEMSQQPDQIVLLASAVSASPDYQVITNLDELLDSEESSVWLDSSVF